MEEDLCIKGDFGKLLVRVRNTDFFIGIGVSFNEGKAMVGCSTIEEDSEDSTELIELIEDRLLLFIILELCLGGLVIIGVTGSGVIRLLLLVVGVLFDVCNCKIGGETGNFSFCVLTNPTEEEEEEEEEEGGEFCQ